MNRNFVFAAAAAFTLSACSGLRDALNAHTDWVARAGSAELTVTKLATLLGKSRAPIRKDIAKSIANVWTDYQLLGTAAAHNDSLNDPKEIDEAMWPAIANLKARKWYNVASKGWSVSVAESTYLAKLEQGGKIEVKKGAVTTVRALGNDPDAYRRDNTELATSTAGKFTTARLVGWLETLPPQARVLDQIKQSPDSLLVQLIRNFVKNELVLKQADSAKIQIEPAELAQLHASFVNAVQSAWSQLGVTPTSLSDSAKSAGDREKLAAKRIDEYFSRMVQEAASFVSVPTPVSNVLRQKYKYSFNDAGFDRAVQEASKIRSSADSARSARQPPTAVPLNPAIPPAPTSSSTPRGNQK